MCHLTGIKTKDHVMKGPLAGALFENFCVTETLKVSQAQADPLNMYYLRTNNNLEVNLILEKQFQTIHPIEIKLTKTPSTRMAKNIQNFSELYKTLAVQPGKLLCLAETSKPLTSTVAITTLSDYLNWVRSL